MTEGQKLDETLKILRSKNPESRCIIFTQSKRGADELTRTLRQRGFNALAIHGDKEQRERDFVLHEFKSGRVTIMVATDVASRGLDVKDIRVVINYDFPSCVEDYIHRVGRAGRKTADGYSEGMAVSFFTDTSAKVTRVGKGRRGGERVGTHQSAARSPSGRAARAGTLCVFVVWRKWRRPVWRKSVWRRRLSRELWNDGEQQCPDWEGLLNVSFYGGCLLDEWMNG